MYCNWSPTPPADQILGPSFRSAFLYFATFVLLAAPVFAKAHFHYGDGFSADVDDPYNMVLKVVEAASEDEE